MNVFNQLLSDVNLLYNYVKNKAIKNYSVFIFHEGNIKIYKFRFKHAVTEN